MPRWKLDSWRVPGIPALTVARSAGFGHLVRLLRHPRELPRSPLRKLPLDELDVQPELVKLLPIRRWGLDFRALDFDPLGACDRIFQIKVASIAGIDIPQLCVPAIDP